ncbi:hypothetical protein FJW06_05385 [Mesorhizobium sp. B4-1-3]|uniref:hypothetical protein n=1 Tax=Mesorhizobium sp. B4-1-3 TaxID=2589889 RepID=UPI001126EEEB|nr:hypothetical protein [Mesorhizobium sp. B4-1-3]TPI15759.1 hypothetical protein FJW06_05385 [Mesorhizobium sp. B4-1-3]
MSTNIIGRFSRRHILAGIAAVPVAAIPAAPRALAAAAEPHDPLIDAIADLNAGNAAYPRHPLVHGTQEENEIAIAETYGPPDDRLKAWNAPAISLEGAVAALRHALYECEMFGVSSDILPNMIAAALGYIERGRGRQEVT